MRPSSIFKGIVLSAACLGLLLPQQVVSAAQLPKKPERVVMDVALGPQGTLQGTVADPNGSAKPATQVALLKGPEIVATTLTDAQGRFRFQKITGGVYGVATDGGVKICRLWANRTAPPAANRAVLLVSGDQTVRAAGPMRDHQNAVYNWISEHYLLTYALIAAAITVPIVLVAAEQSRS